jgi:SSS family solute:Na+ symporter
MAARWRSCAPLIIMLSYLGWVSAQVTALGLVFNLLSGGAISISMGMVIGTWWSMAYTLFGGMWSVAVTDFIQMIILVVGLVLIRRGLPPTWPAARTRWSS